MLQPENVNLFDRFGSAVAIEGDTLVAGAPEGGTSGSGAVYVYTRDGTGVWTEQVQLSAHNTDRGDKFGSDVDLRDGVLLIGASGEDNQAGQIGGGAAYVFSRDVSQQWQQSMYLRAQNGEEQDAFGSTVAIGDAFYVVGAMFESKRRNRHQCRPRPTTAHPDSGAVYVFE